MDCFGKLSKILFATTLVAGFATVSTALSDSVVPEEGYSVAGKWYRFSNGSGLFGRKDCCDICPPSAVPKKDQKPPTRPEKTPDSKPALPSREEVTTPMPEAADVMPFDLSGSLAAPAAPLSIAPNMIGDFLGLTSFQATTATISAPTTLTFTVPAGMPGIQTITLPAIAGVVPAGQIVSSTMVFGGGEAYPIAVFINPLLNTTYSTPSGTIQLIQGTSFFEFFDGSTPVVDLFGLDTFGLNITQITSAFIPVNVANPSGGGNIGRFRIAENNSPLPHHRIFFDYSHFNDVNIVSPQRLNIDRFIFGVESSFFDDWMSIQLVVPFGGTLNSDQVSGPNASVGNLEFGNVALALKVLLLRSNSLAVSSGLGLSLPTADNSRVTLAGTARSIVEIDNRAVILSPFVGGLWTSGDRFFAQGFMSIDLDPSGNPVDNDLMDGNGLQRAGVLTGQEILIVDFGMGYWVYRDNSGYGLVSGIAPIVELHYNTTLGDPDFVQRGGLVIGDFAGNLDVLNLTIGSNVELRRNTDLRVGLSIPLRNGADKQFDFEAQAQLNVRFGNSRR